MKHPRRRRRDGEGFLTLSCAFTFTTKRTFPKGIQHWNGLRRADAHDARALKRKWCFSWKVSNSIFAAKLCRTNPLNGLTTMVTNRNFYLVSATTIKPTRNLTLRLITHTCCDFFNRLNEVQILELLISTWTKVVGGGDRERFKIKIYQIFLIAFQQLA